MSIGTTIKAVGHYIDQPAVIEKVGKRAGWLGVGGMLALWGMDTYRARPHERREIAIRDALVLGVTALGTLLAARKFMMPFVKPAEMAKARIALKQAVDSLADRYSPGLRALMLKETKSPAEFKALIQGMARETETRLADKRLARAAVEGDLQKVLPVELDESIRDSLGKMGKFFVVGGASVLSGLLGGLAANKVNGKMNAETTVNMVKEGIFQFIANIALCAVGASAAIGVVNLPPVKKGLQNLGMIGKLSRTGIIGVGLCLGILGGGAIANAVGERWVNPFFDKLQGKAVEATGKRKVEFWDAILHLDDLPTALALAGMAIMEPFIPLFFSSGFPATVPASATATTTTISRRPLGRHSGAGVPHMHLPACWLPAGVLSTLFTPASTWPERAKSFASDSLAVYCQPVPAWLA